MPHQASLTAALLLALVVGCAPGVPHAESENPRTAAMRPNVLFILVDDLRPEIGAYGVERAVTPNIDRLASQGLLFENAYTQQAVCAPSRAALLSGLRPDSTGIYDLVTPLRTVMPNHVTLPQHFRSHGYITAGVGKVYHHRDDDPQGWSLPHPAEDPNGRRNRYRNLESLRQVDAWERANPGKPSRGPAFEAAEVPDSMYEDGQTARQAIEHLRRMQHDPFFLVVGMVKPHLPFNAPQKYWDLYPADGIRLPEPYSPPEGATPYSLVNFGELRNYTNIPASGPLSDQLARELIRGYLAATSYADAQIGLVLDELDRLGLRENTIVVLWGDHGYKLGDHANWVKHSNFEIDTRIPLIIRAPGLTKEGQRSTAFVETVDLYPTLAELAGLPEPAHQGLSFVPLLRDPDRAWKSAAFSQYPRGRGVMGRSIRTRDFRYVEWRGGPQGEVMARELYDHRHDPGETRNVAADPAYEQIVLDHSRQLAAGWREALPATTPAQASNR